MIKVHCISIVFWKTNLVTTTCNAATFLRTFFYFLAVQRLQTITINITVDCMFLSCHVCVIEWIYTLYSCLDVKELSAQNWRDIWSLSDCNGIRTHKYLVRKRALCKRVRKWLHLAKMAIKSFLFHLPTQFLNARAVFWASVEKNRRNISAML